MRSHSREATVRRTDAAKPLVTYASRSKVVQHLMLFIKIGGIIFETGRRSNVIARRLEPYRDSA